MAVSAWLPASVVTVEPATDSGRLIRLQVPGWPGSEPGQHLDLRLTADDGYQAVRSYSISSFGPGESIEIGVDEFPDGEVSPYLVRDARPGDQLEVRGPIGRYFVWSPAQPEPVQLIAGGSGIVPLVSIVRAHHASASRAPFRLLHSVRTSADAMFATELRGLAGDRFEPEWIYTRRAPDGERRAPGRIDAGTLLERSFPAADAPLVYICGPTGFVEAVATIMVGLGHPSRQIRTERFGGI